MAVYGYCRVSTMRAAAEGESLIAQERALRGYAMQHDFSLGEIFIERGVSGSVPFGKRPEGGKLLAGLTSGDVIITPKLDRCFRSALDALDVLNKLKAQGVSLHMLDLGGDVTGNGVSRLVFTILSAVAEAERDRIRERVGEVKADQKRRGRYLGGSVPFGWRVGDEGDLIADPVQQDAIQLMQEMHASGSSLRSIAAVMRDQGHTLSHVAVQRVLRDAQSSRS